MAFDINDFFSNLSQYGTSLASKFDVQITLPNFMSNVQFNGQNQNNQALINLPRMLQFRAESVVLPSVVQLALESKRYGLGPSTTHPYNAVFSDIPMTFLCDRGGLIYYFFFTWMNSIYNFAETDVNNSSIGIGTTSNISPSYTANYEDDIVSNVIGITIYDHAGHSIMTIQLYRAKPMMLVGQPFDWNQTNKFVTLNINFRFREFSVAMNPSNNNNLIGVQT